MSVNLSRWIDIEGPDFKQVEDHQAVKKLVKTCLELDLITIDKNGYMWYKEYPVHAEIGLELVGLRYSSKASN